MNIAKVRGTVVCTKKKFSIEGGRLLLLEKMTHEIQGKKDYVVALDLIGAGTDEIVMICEGSPCRETPDTIGKPLDAIIVGIIDIIDVNDKIVYQK